MEIFLPHQLPGICIYMIVLRFGRFLKQSMRDYLTIVKSSCDNLSSFRHPIEEMQQISIVLNRVKGQFDNVIYVIHASTNPYHMASVSSVLLYAKARQVDLLFDTNVTANVVVNHNSTMKNETAGSYNSSLSSLTVSPTSLLLTVCYQLIEIITLILQ